MWTPASPAKDYPRFAGRSWIRASVSSVICEHPSSMPTARPMSRSCGSIAARALAFVSPGSWSSCSVAALGWRVTAASGARSGSRSRSRCVLPSVAGRIWRASASSCCRRSPLGYGLSPHGWNDLANAIVVEPDHRIGDARASEDMDDCRRFVMVLDGRGIQPVELALAMRQQCLVGDVPLVLLTATRGLLPLDQRRYFVTSISPTSSDERYGRRCGSSGRLVQTWRRGSCAWDPTLPGLRQD